MASYDSCRERLRAFVDAREWDVFHTPKDLALSLTVEAGELLELFQWQDAHEPLDEAARVRVAEETADIVTYAMLLADKAGIDLWQAVEDKLAANAAKYPVEKARGRADKYDRL